jgi:adenine-specific DNA-methyltransferase
MASRRTILELMTRKSLLQVAAAFEIGGLTGWPKEEIIDTIAKTRSIPTDEILELFSRDELKEICSLLGVEGAGNAKKILIDRILGRTGENERPARGNAMAKRQSKKSNSVEGDLFKFGDYRHDKATRKNNPPAKIAAEGKIPILPKIEYHYSPRRPPILQFDPTGKADKLPTLLEQARKRPITYEEASTLSEALQVHEPWLEWAGKRESQSKGFTVDPVALHIHERVSSKAILKVAARQNVTRSLFADPEQEYQQAVQFYKHDIDWTNRLILGDSLQVMTSLARREDLSGKVQMIYIDPPYGIKFASNFQAVIGNRDVRDKEQDLTREPEMVKAYRDTWELGTHSYLCYLKDRLLVARDLLSDSGSIFVQMSDQNLHRVRLVMDEVFGANNFCGQIQFKKTGYASTEGLATICDYLLWYAKDNTQVFVNTLFVQRKLEEKDTAFFDRVELANGEWRALTLSEQENPDAIPQSARILARNPLVSPGYLERLSQPIIFEGEKYQCAANSHWKTTPEGIERLVRARRITKKGNTIRMVRYFEDYSVSTPTNTWMDLGSGGFVGDDKQYVVQTDSRVIQRCMFLASKPGDLVLDPTCGSGTTAHVAEQWGRRWITIDTSRVAIAIARQRLLTGRYEYYRLRDASQGIAGKFKYKTVPHITLKSIAQNTNLDPIFAKHEAILDEKLTACNAALTRISEDTRRNLGYKLKDKESTEGRKAVSDADRRRWVLPKKGEKWQHWQVPFDADPDWPKELQERVKEYRDAWRAKMDEVNACITANADQEELVDQPEVVKGIVRVSGPFTVEAVQPPEIPLAAMEAPEAGGMFDGEPEELEEVFSKVPKVAETTRDWSTTKQGLQDAKNIEAYLDQMIRLLRTDGLRFPGNKQTSFSRLEPIAGGSAGLHAEGRWMPEGKQDDDLDGRAGVCVAFGPQYGPVTALQVERLIRSANRRGYDDLVVAGFSFDAPAQAVIEESKHPRLRVHMAHIRPDVNPAMNGLLKEQPGSQLFTVFGQPRTRVDGPDKRGEYTVTMEGVDIYNPVDNSIISTGADKVAAWFLDGDYDGRTFCITQAFFPDRSAWDKLSKALTGVVDPERFAAFSGTVSLPFPAGKYRCVAVKVIDPRGNEVMQVHKL